MIRIGAITQPTWVDVADGVRLLCQPVTSLVLSMAKVDVAKLDFSDEGDDAKRAQDSIKYDLLCRQVARIVITEWEGIGDMDGQPVAVDPVIIDALMNNNAIFNVFKMRVMAPAFALVAEKKG